MLLLCNLIPIILQEEQVFFLTIQLFWTCVLLLRDCRQVFDKLDILTSLVDKLAVLIKYITYCYKQQDATSALQGTVNLLTHLMTSLSKKVHLPALWSTFSTAANVCFIWLWPITNLYFWTSWNYLCIQFWY